MNLPPQSTDAPGRPPTGFFISYDSKPRSIETQMKDIPFIFMLTALVALPAASYAQSTPVAAASVPVITGIAAVDEDNLIAQIRATALVSDTATILSMLEVPSRLPDSAVPSVTLARRSFAVCVWLQVDGKGSKALTLTTAALAALSSLTETNGSDHADRLYWEALLTGRILDQKVAAIALLEKARAISPADQRIIQLELSLANAVATFGR